MRRAAVLISPWLPSGEPALHQQLLHRSLKSSGLLDTPQACDMQSVASAPRAGMTGLQPIRRKRLPRSGLPNARCPGADANCP